MVFLQVGNLPSNRLALTNRVYVSPSCLRGLIASSNSPESSSSSSTWLVTVGPHPYVADAHPTVPDDTVAMNGLQRRFALLTLGSRVDL